VKCANCPNEHGVTVLKTIKAGKEMVEIKYGAGMVTVDDRVLCWFCATPFVGTHL